MFIFLFFLLIKSAIMQQQHRDLIVNDFFFFQLVGYSLPLITGAAHVCKKET